MQQREVRRPNDACWCGSGEKYKRCHREADAKEARVAARQAEIQRVRPGWVSPRRSVPVHIPRPDYAESGRPAARASREVRTAEEMERLRRACRAAAEVLAETARGVGPGVTTDALDALAHEAYLARGGYPSTLNYRGFPKSLCTSVNEIICHGIPDSRPLADGDIVNLDITIYLDGMHGDCSATFPVGQVDEAGQRLIRVTEECLQRGIDAVRPGRPVSDIGRAIEAHATQNGFGVVRAFCGHGIGPVFHSGLQIPHYFDPEASTRMEPGMTFTIEPMLTEGTWQARLWDDGWTAVTADGRRSAQAEHTLLVTDNGVEVLTLPPSA
jgi:methionyl aminopeptidase